MANKLIREKKPNPPPLRKPAKERPPGKPKPSQRVGQDLGMRNARTLLCRCKFKSVFENPRRGIFNVQYTAWHVRSRLRRGVHDQRSHGKYSPFGNQTINGIQPSRKIVN